MQPARSRLQQTKRPTQLAPTALWAFTCVMYGPVPLRCSKGCVRATLSKPAGELDRDTELSASHDTSLLQHNRKQARLRQKEARPPAWGLEATRLSGPTLCLARQWVRRCTHNRPAASEHSASRQASLRSGHAAFASCKHPFKSPRGRNPSKFACIARPKGANVKFHRAEFLPEAALATNKHWLVSDVDHRPVFSGRTAVPLLQLPASDINTARIHTAEQSTTFCLRVKAIV